MSSHHVIHVNDTVCADVTYLNATDAFGVEVDVNGNEVWHDTFSIHHTAKKCFGVPFIKKLAKICARAWAPHLGLPLPFTEAKPVCVFRASHHHLPLRAPRAGVDLTDIEANTTHVSACIEAELDLIDKKVTHVDLGCFGFHIHHHHRLARMA